MVKNAGLPAQAGQSLIEMIIAIAVFTVIITAAAMVFYGGSSSVYTQKSSGGALERARTGLEAARIIRDSGWSNLTDGIYGVKLNGTTWQLIPTNDTDGTYTRTVAISTIDDDTKKIVASVSWQTEQQNTQTVGLTTALSRWQDIVNAELLFGDWTKPRVVASIDIGSGNEATGIAYKNGKVYISGSAPSAAKPDFFIIDVSNPESPQLLSSLNIETGLVAVAVSGNYAYVIEKDSSDFFIIDISNASAPTKVSKLTIGGGDGRALAVTGSFVYVGHDDTVSVINVANPAIPSLVGELRVADDINGISIFGSTLYLATRDGHAELMIVNITNRTSPTLISQYDAEGGSENGKSVQGKNNGRVYLGRLKGGNHTNHHEFFVINASSPTSPSFLGSLDIPSDINALVVISNLAFLATTDTNKEFQILNIAGLPTITAYASLNLPQQASGIVFNNNYIFLSMKSNDALKVITSTP